MAKKKTKAQRKAIALKNLEKARSARGKHKARRAAGRKAAVGTLRGTYSAAKARYHQAGEALYIAEHGHSIRAGKKRKRKKTGHKKSR